MGFFAGGPGALGWGGPHYGHEAQQPNNGASAVFSFAMVVLTFMLSSHYPMLVPLLTSLVHFFPDQFAQIRNLFVESPYQVVYLITFVIAFIFLGFGGAGEWEDQDDFDGHYEQRYAHSRRAQEAAANMHRQQQQEFRRQHSQQDMADDMEGSWAGSVFMDFFLTILLMGSTFMLPQLWMFLNRGILRVLPEGGRQTWLRWTSVLRPAAAAPGTVPTSREALNKLESITLEERHLLMENSPAGITCPVCLDAMHVGDIVKRLPCKHLFHPSCVIPWLEKHNSCPTCRYELETNDPTYEYHRQARERERQAGRSPTASAAASSSSSSAQPVSSAPQQSASQAAPQAVPQAVPQANAAPMSPTRAAEMERLLRLTVPELRSIARRRGVNWDGAIEKRELVARIMRAQHS
ncbi:E3 ubiquitin-protein ligase RING1-like [Hondaea fermentalgiana]|uniref:RING-type E3 ubiquitin transferase n=1 Tax=Hondaea fermentalgiana TaxID=2315210 RepID=A0A2R5GWD8_9STRA|nr:E3 ubiquitin-protein ligase RING1-like [Hondaea fermentalgiana]|eukprot:GBG34649.1 E3 ubiquitin-protein ligase RING1-like [Hondaea fermentalgiana]